MKALALTSTLKSDPKCWELLCKEGDSSFSLLLFDEALRHQQLDWGHHLLKNGEAPTSAQLYSWGVRAKQLGERTLAKTRLTAATQATGATHSFLAKALLVLLSLEEHSLEEAGHWLSEWLASPSADHFRELTLYLQGEHAFAAGKQRSACQYLEEALLTTRMHEKNTFANLTCDETLPFAWQERAFYLLGIIELENRHTSPCSRASLQQAPSASIAAWERWKEWQPSNPVPRQLLAMQQLLTAAHPPDKEKLSSEATYELWQGIAPFLLWNSGSVPCASRAQLREHSAAAYPHFASAYQLFLREGDLENSRNALLWTGFSALCSERESLIETAVAEFQKQIELDSGKSRLTAEQSVDPALYQLFLYLILELADAEQGTSHGAMMRLTAEKITTAAERHLPPSAVTALYLKLAHLEERAGCLEKAEELYNKILQIAPKGEAAAKALFLLANTAERRGEDDNKVQRLRAALWRTYPFSPYASEAFLLYYPWRKYLEGDELALEHLRKMVQKFPSSPFTLYGAYLLATSLKKTRGIHCEQWREAIDLFAWIESTFDRLVDEKSPLLEEHRLPLSKLRCQCSISRASLLIKLSEREEAIAKQLYWLYAEQTLSSLVHSLNSSSSPLALINEEERNLFADEATLILAKLSAAKREHGQAKELLKRIIEPANDQAENQSREFHRLRAAAWKELAILAQEENNLSDALSALKNREQEGARSGFSPQEGGELLIDLSRCLIALQRHDEAMLLLSKLVNDCTAPPLQRREALWLRAEIYQKQGRRELYKRQLEAIAEGCEDSWKRRAIEILTSTTE